MFKSIIWATDGSASADRALPYVKSLASAGNTEVLVLHADQLLMSRSGQHVLADEDDVRDKIDAQAKELSDAGITAGARIVKVTTGTSPAHTIADTAREVGSDLIVVGTRGHTALGGLLLGSVTQRLLHIAPCPVFAVPAATGGEASQTEAAAAETTS